jgi:hypothetical protein
MAKNMGTLQATRGLTFTMPTQEVIDVSGDSETAFSIKASGEGSLTGLAYTVPAHTVGIIRAKLNLLAISSEDVKNLNTLALGMLDASEREEIRTHEETSASADLSVWSWFFGGGKASASYKETRDTMLSKGLTDEQINTLMDAFMTVATNMSAVEIEFTVYNQNSDYSVSGDLYLWTVSGTIQTDKGTAEYRLLADQGNAGDPPGEGGAPASGKIIPLN